MFCLVQTTAISCRALSQLETSKHISCTMYTSCNDAATTNSTCTIRELVCVCRTVSHFMVVTESEFLLVDPARSKIGWGTVHFISFLQVCWLCNHVQRELSSVLLCLSTGCGCGH